MSETHEQAPSMVPLMSDAQLQYLTAALGSLPLNYFRPAKDIPVEMLKQLVMAIVKELEAPTRNMTDRELANKLRGYLL